MFMYQRFMPGLAIASYVVGDEKAKRAVVIDPTRDVDEYIRIAHAEGLHITHILETHVHADYVSGAADDKLGLHINIGSLGPSYFFGGYVDKNGFTIVSEMTRIYVSPGDEISTGGDSRLDISGHFEPIAP